MIPSKDSEDDRSGQPTPSRLDWFIGVCERFESARKAKMGSQIEDFIGEADDPDRPSLLRELLAMEVQLRVRCGEQPTRREYLERFPSDAAEVEAAFGATEVAPPSGPALDGLAPRSLGDSVDQGARMKGGQSVTTSEMVPCVLDGVVAARGRPVRPDVPGEDPETIGRYSVIRRLGEGGFGLVYLALDSELDRNVAIKVPRRHRFGSSRHVEMFLNEARMTVRVNHPAIVTVHDVGQQPDGTVYIVLEYIEGQPLSDLLRMGKLPLDRSVGLLVRVAEALHHAHRRGIVHRDLKPDNILIDADGNPHVTDFGLALHEDTLRLRSGEVAGTAAYMAPEQVRGEVHRLDGRTDVWALGVILYRVLAGRTPFSGDRGEQLDEILNREPKPPRQLDDTVPKELERVCLKCLSKRMADRYNTAIDLAEDLRHWLDGSRASASTSALEPGANHVVPKGLRSYDGGDAEFFLSLLPGPRGRDGLPESLRFWKAWAEGRDDEPARAAGLLYGPSGGGKSSMIKAGLLPTLDESVRPVYVEATRDQTEARLLAALRRTFPALDVADDLAGATAMLREGQADAGDRKTLIVLDQFEQWLQSDRADAETDLVRALRHCDGRRVQALILVRDDFWMAVTRFFKRIEVAMVEGRNSAAAELFDPAHARRVLAQFGRACGQIPDGPGEPGPETSAFLEHAVAALAGPTGGIPPVHLSLFYEVVRKRPWTPATLRDLGGIEGIGMTFIEEAFDVRTSPPSHRVHRDAAQSVLQSLLPTPASVLRGGSRPDRELMEASGYAKRPDDFADLMRILDSELRMVTAVRPDEADGSPTGTTPGEDLAYYQLAHEFLITPIRQWIERKQRATRAGRARIRLATITASWCDRPVPQRLASPLEWISILWLTRPGTWSPDERRMMHATMRRTLIRAAATLAIVSAVAVVGTRLRDREQAETRLQRFLNADFANLPGLLPELEPYKDWLRNDLEDREARPSATTRHRRIATLLLYRDRPTGRRAAALHEWVHDAGPDELPVIREALALHPSEAGVDRMLRDLRDDASEPAARLRLACILVRLDPGGIGGGDFAGRVLMPALLAEDHRTLPRWLELLGPAVPLLIPPLREVCRDPDRDASVRSKAAEALAEALASRGDAKGLANAVVESQDDASLILRLALERLQDRMPALAVFRAFLGPMVETAVDRLEADELARRQANAAIGLAALQEAESLWPLLRHRDDPCLRALLIVRLANSKLPPNLLLDRMARPILDPVERQALLLAWAEATRDSVTPPVAATLIESARNLYFHDPDSGVHSAAEVVATRWGDPGLLGRWEEQLGGDGSPVQGRGWVLAPNGQTLVILRGPLIFRMGSPEDETWRLANETPQVRRIDRSIAVATKEVTVEQFRRFNPAHPQDLRHSTEPGCPANNVTWIEAAHYCNWLSREAGLEECYEIRPGGVILNRAEGRYGYRLPTEAEAEFFGRGGARTAYPFGESETLLERYAWTWLNSGDLTRPVGRLLPNEFGLFDAQGNVMEWCHDGVRRDADPSWPPYPSGTPEHPAPDPLRPETVDTNDAIRFLRGGFFESPPGSARPAYRHGSHASLVRAYGGLRVVRTIPPDDERSP